SAEHAGAAQPGDRADDDDRATATLRHPGNDHLAQPQNAFDVGTHDLVERLVGEIARRAEHRIDGGIADHDVDRAIDSQRLDGQPLALVLARDIARTRRRLAARIADAPRNSLAGVSLAAGDDHLGAEPRHQFGAGAADAAARAGDDGDLAAEIEWRIHV